MGGWVGRQAGRQVGSGTYAGIVIDLSVRACLTVRLKHVLWLPNFAVFASPQTHGTLFCPFLQPEPHLTGHDYFTLQAGWEAGSGNDA